MVIQVAITRRIRLEKGHWRRVSIEEEEGEGEREALARGGGEKGRVRT